MNQQSIIEELKKGNEKLLAEIYSQYRNQFISYSVKRFPVDFEVLREIYQDVIMAFYNNILEGRLVILTSSLKSYLFEIGKHMIYKHLRQKNIPIKYSDSVIERFSYIPDTRPETNEEDEISIFLRSEISKLGEKCFRILKMFYFEKQNMEQIAAALNFSNVDSAKTQKYKCFERLREAVKSKYSRTIDL